jgi:hypothetical protein
MSLYVVDSPLVGDVILDLLTICPDEGFELDTLSGEISYTSTSGRYLGCEVLASLIDTDTLIAIQGQTPGWFFNDPVTGDPRTLKDWAGTTGFDRFPDPTEIGIIYDATDCDGAGRWALGVNTPIPFPTHIVLFHELAHAYNLVSGALLGPFDPAEHELQAIILENYFRASLGVCNLQSGQGCRDSDKGGCNPPPGSPPPPPPPPQTVRGPCFVATAAYGSPLEPEVQFLRSFRDDVLRQTRAGNDFFDHFYKHYNRISPIITDMMEQDKDIKELVRWAIVSPIVKYLQLLMHFPDAPVEDLDEPWRSFLQELRDDLEGWVKEIRLPDNFHGLSASDVAKEIEIVTRYGLRRQGARQAYLNHLEKLGQIPLHAPPNEKREVARRLLASGISKNDIKRILGDIAL